MREIKFPEPITAVCFLNPQGDILVGHIGKVSSVMSVDYKPFESKELTAFNEGDIFALMNQPTRTLVTDSTFQKLKKQDDDIKR